MVESSRDRRWYRQSGPGVLVAAAFIGPGTVTVCTIAGVSFGYELLWALLLSVIATLLLQEMSARIGLVTGKGLTEVIREQLHARPFAKMVVLTLIICAIVIGNAAYEAGNLSGGRLGLESALGLEQSEIGPWLTLLLGSAAFAILFSGSYRVLERALTALVVLMSLSFLTTAILTRRDTVIAVSLGGLVSMSILVSAAAADVSQVSNAGDLARSLEPLYGSTAKYLLGIGLFASLGINPIDIIRLAQIANGITLPVVAGIVLWLINTQLLPERYRNTRLHNMAGLAILMITVALGIRSIALVLSSLSA
jgi:manganese transport protein